MKIYVAGPITKGHTFANVRNALDAATLLLRMDHQPFVPHLTCFWDMIHPVEYERWLQYDFVWISACDALLRIPGDSDGADREVTLARKLGIPVYYRVEDIPPAL